jgi:hypothetical protein
MIHERDDKPLVYRLRSLDTLLGEKYRELERQTIYFAPFSDLNDPMEGISDMIWLGDSIVWKNLLIHYLLCMEHKVSLATLFKPEESEQFFMVGFPILRSEAELPTDMYRQHFEVIKNRFFSYDPVNAMVDYLGNRTSPLRKNQISAILSLLTDIALESILYGHAQSNLQPQPFWDSLRDSTRASVDILSHAVSILNAPNSISEEDSNALLTITNMSMQEASLITQCKMGEETISKINWYYFRSGFLQEYLDQIPQLVYPDWYSASFISKFPENPVLWGHYGDSHKGVCLIFKAHRRESWSDYHLKLRKPEGDNSVSSAFDVQLHDIKYSDEKEPEVEFFKRLWTLPAGIVCSEWYSDRSGRKSVFMNESNPTESIRLAYWDKLNRIQTTKSKNWSYEHEKRVLINGSFYDFSKPENRTFSYNFHELEGLVFGLRTSTIDKVKIIRVIAQKCIDNKRNDFSFFQARYDDKENRIVCDELRSIKFSL